MWLVRRELPLMAALLAAILGGCSAGPEPLTYLGHADLKYYKDLATKIDYPSAAAPDNCEALASQEPPRVGHPRKEALWDMSMQEAIKIALKNNKIIRTRDQVQFPRNPLVVNPEQSPSIYDPALQETGTQFGQRGVEAALSDFDASFTSSMTWGHSANYVNNSLNAGGLPPGSVLEEDTATFKARIDKIFADGSTFSLINEWDYLLNNEPSNLFPSVYTGFERVEYRRPFLSGAGEEYNRIAGPTGKNPSGVGGGVVIARINSDIAIADFEANVHTLVRDVQSSYWDLALAYHTFHAETVAWHTAIDTWRLISAKTSQGLKGGGAADEAQARETVFDSQAREEDALANLYSTEGRFRRLLGLPVNDGRIIRPCDDPAVAEFLPEWHLAVAEGITRRPEIRRQKWNIKSLELQLCAAKNLVQPRLDFVAGYQLNAFGQELISEQPDPIAPGSSAFASLAEAGQSSWNIGFEFSVTPGFRSAHSQVRNYELRLARARAGLATQELDIAHEIRESFQNMDRAYTVARASLNRRSAALERVKSYETLYDLGSLETADPLLRAIQSLSQAEVAYYQSLVQYNQAIADFYYRTGTILDESNVIVSEDMWDPAAYTDALRRAWARSHAIDAPFMHTKPAEFVVPPGQPTGAVPLMEATAVDGIGPRDVVPPLLPAQSPQVGPPQPGTLQPWVPQPGAPQPGLPLPTPESAPAPPLPAPPGGPSRLPQATSPLPADGFGGGNAAGLFQSPALVPSSSGMLPTPMQAPEALATPASGARPADTSGGSLWSLPKANSGFANPPGAAAPMGSSDAIQDAHGDGFDMPTNEAGQ
jgi:outer membrane protein TolC